MVLYPGLRSQVEGVLKNVIADLLIGQLSAIKSSSLNLYRLGECEKGPEIEMLVP